MAASSPTEETLGDFVTPLREKFEAKYADAINDGESYDTRDVERFKEDDRYTKCFVRSFAESNDMEKVADKVNEIFKFRKGIKINDLKEDSFDDALIDPDKKSLYWKGNDKEGRKIMYFRVANHTKGSMVQETKDYIAYSLEQHHKVSPGPPDRILMVFDFTGAGITNMDLDVVKFIISALSTYFPGVLHRILLFEMPWLVSTIWKVIKSWLSEEQKDKITQVKKSNITDYIEESELEAHMKK